MAKDLLVYTGNPSLKRLLNSWSHPGPKHRRLREGISMRKLYNGVVLFSSSEEAMPETVRLLLRLKWTYREDVMIFSVEVMSSRALSNLLDGLSGGLPLSAGGSPLGS